MPTRSGALIKAKFEVLLRRDLTADEVLKCEELAINYHTGPILSYLEREAKKPLLALFETVHAALSNGVLRDAGRQTWRKTITGRLATVFKKLDLYNPGMSDGEMLAVQELAHLFTDSHIDRAIVIARSRGIKHVRYVLQVCVGNAKKPTGPKKQKMIATMPSDVPSIGLNPKTEDVEKSWAKSLEGAEERSQLNEIERMVRRND